MLAVMIGEAAGIADAGFTNVSFATVLDDPFDVAL
jgi:hypothetical protein